MITPELIGYIRGEFTKGRTREEIRVGLMADGGWNEADLSEAFRMIVPMQNYALSNTNIITQNNTTALTIKNKTKPSRKILGGLIFIVIVISCGLSWYFYNPQIINFWNSGVESSEELSFNSWNWLINNFKKTFGINQVQNNPVMPQNDTVEKKIVEEIVPTKDCGTTDSPDLKNPLLYESDAVLICLGNSALHCTDSKAILKDPLFPTIFQIVKNRNASDACNFKLSYGADSVLIDITGNKLAGQSISCPLNIVKALDETKKPPLFTIPSLDNLGEYASQIYFYGTLGLFIENGIDKNKIQTLGCSGDYIDSVIASYQKMQSKK